MSEKIDMFQPFEITSVSREDLQEYFSKEDIALLDDGSMARIASKMADDYLEQMYWLSLEIITKRVLEEIKKERGIK
jgi:hypothetical protein